MTRDAAPLGKVITFYSYKGGTGRSMAVANMGCWLAQRREAPKVLLMDWDLEAPGLSKYFAATTELPEYAERPGIINYFNAILQRLKSDPDLYAQLTSASGVGVLEQEFPLQDFLVKDIAAGVDLLKSGRIDNEYRALINTFDWVEFFNQFGGVIDVFRKVLTARYNYCLVDSRTGFTDASGICTMLLPEKLVLVFTPNGQSLSGVLDVTVWATQFRRTSNDLRPLSIFPLASRIENAELKLKEEWRGRYQREFEKTLRAVYQLEACDLTAYFNAVQLPHVAYYSYGERIAVLEEQTSDSLSLSKAYEAFFQTLITLDTPWEDESSTLEPTNRGIDGAGGAKRSREPSVFISYAQIDNRPFAEDTEGWVDTLQKALANRLAELVGERVNVWSEQKLAGNDFVNDSIFLQLAQSDYLVCVVSPAYVRSEWARQELDAFSRHNAGSGDGVASIFKINKMPVSREEEPSALENLMGYNFYEYEPASGRALEFPAPTSGSGDRRFWERLNDLAHDIAKQLRLRGRATAGAPKETSAGKVVYLAETTSDLIDARESIKRDLRQHGHMVLPEVGLPLHSVPLRELLRSDLKRSDLAVHLIGAHYGIVPEGETRSLLEVQVALASERGGGSADFPQLVWLPRGLHPADKRQQELVARLTQSADAPHEVLQVALEELKTLIHDKLKAPLPPVSGTRGNSVIYLNYIAADMSDVAPIEDHLFECGFELLAPVEDPAEHRENLLVTDAVLVYCGRASETWLQLQRRELLKLAGYGRTRPLIKAFYLAPPQMTWKDRFRTQDGLVIRNYSDPVTDALLPFTAQIAAAAGGAP